MGPLVRCRVCGYVMAEEKLGDKCPACGAPRAVFEPFTDRISERRRKLLDLHLHLVMVHFPQAFSVTVLALAFAPLIFRGEAEELLFATLKILALALPAAAAVAFAAGIVDGRLRFKQVRRSPILRRKLVLASLLVVFSVAEAAVLWLGSGPDSATVPVILLALLAFLCSFGLGLLGIKVAYTEMPGD
jgi:uncharacterized membrane protein/rubredoxin